MNAIQYLKNQMILENCKEYLKLLDFLPWHNDIWNSVNESSEVVAYQNFNCTKNCIEIAFYIRSFFWGISELNLEVKLINNCLAKINVFKSDLNNDYPNLTRTVEFLNNDICKVIDKYSDEDFKNNREIISYYIGKKLIHTSLNECELDKSCLKKINFVEQETISACDSLHHEVKYERDYVEKVCYRQKYHEDKETLSHNQFEKKNKGILKRVKKLGKILEK